MEELIKKGYVERIYVRTPHNGDYSEAHYFDEFGVYTTKDKANHIIIRECKKDGTLLFETNMYRDNALSNDGMSNHQKRVIDMFALDISIDLAKEKGLYEDSKLTDNFYKLYLNYKKLLDKYLLRILPLDSFDKEIDNSDLRFIPKRLDDMDKYQLMSFMNLKYIYLRNPLYVERLSVDEINRIINLSREELDNPGEDVYMIIENTFRKVMNLKENIENLDSDILDSLLESGQMVFGVKIDFEAENGLGEGQEWLDNYSKQKQFINEETKKVGNICSEKLNLKVNFCLINDNLMQNVMIK